MLVGQKKNSALDSAALLTADEYTAVVQGTDLLVQQLEQQNPLMPREALYSGAVTLILGEIIRVRGSMKKYRELLGEIESSGQLDEALLQRVRTTLRPERSRVVIPGGGT